MKRMLSIIAALMFIIPLHCYASDYYITTRLTISGYRAISPGDRWIVIAPGMIEVATTGTFYISGELIFSQGTSCQHGGYMSIQNSGIVTVQNDANFYMWGSMIIQSNGVFNVEDNGYAIFSYPTTVASSGTIIADGDVSVGNTCTLTVEGTLNIPVNGVFETSGVVEIINGGQSNVTGKHTIIPGGYLNIYDQSILNINPKGIVELNAGLSILRMFSGASMHLISDVTDHAEIIIHDRAIVNLFDSSETVVIDDGSFIQFETTASQFAISSWGDGLVECYGSRPFRGTGSLHRMHINFYQDFIVAADDHLYFKYGANMAFLNGNGATISVESETFASPIRLGYLEFRGVVGNEAFNIGGTLTSMNVAAEATFKIAGAASVWGLPAINGGPASVLDFTGIPSARTPFEFIPITGGITTEGILTATNILFHGPIVPGWTGIHIIGPASKVILDSCAILEFNDAVGLHLSGSNNSANLIRKSEIITPVMLPFTGKGLFLDLDANLVSSYIRVKCCHIHGSGTGVHNLGGSLQMLETTIVGTDLGIVSENAESSIYNTCVFGCFGNGITVDGIPAGSGFTMFNSRVYKNLGLQVELLNNANAVITSSAIFYDLGNNTQCLVRTYGTSVALMTNNWWGVYPITPMMFDPQNLSIIDTTGAEPVDLAWANCDCSRWGKQAHPHNIAPVSIALRNYPNPFNPSTTIEYSLPKDMPVEITVYSMDGRKVATLMNEQKQAGTHCLRFQMPEASASGIYFYTLRTPDEIVRRSMFYIK